jgi:hypothetical protein
MVAPDASRFISVAPGRDRDDGDTHRPPPHRSEPAEVDVPPLASDIRNRRRMTMPGNRYLVRVTEEQSRDESSQLQALIPRQIYP